MTDANEHTAVIDAFRKIYEEPGSSWGNMSGPGSDPRYTIQYRAFIDQFLYLNKIGSVVDIGCGDWQFSKYINYSSVQYLGLDVVESVISRNAERHSTDRVRFSLMPGALSDVPQADLLIMKDVLQHLPNATIRDFIEIVFPRFKFCLITNSFRKLDTAQNVDVAAGDFRCLDLTAAPYHCQGTYLFEFTSPVWEELRVLLVQSRAA